jgi:hypothetical protein
MGALLRLELHGFPHPVAELAATVGGYRSGAFLATFESLWLKSSAENFKYLDLKNRLHKSVLSYIRSIACRYRPTASVAKKNTRSEES